MTSILSAPPAVPARTVAAGAARSGSGAAERPIRRLGLRKGFPFSRLAGVLLLLAVWAVGSLAGFIDARKLSAPWTVVTTAVDLIATGTLQEHIAASLSRAAVGFAFGVVIGTALAVVAGLTRSGDALIDGPIQLKRAIPTLGLIPLLILWLGIGETFKIVIIALGVVVHMYIQTHNSLTSIDNRYVELAEVLGLSRATFIRKVVLPGAMPGFFLGLRLSVTGAWLTLIVVEGINAVTGLGKMMYNAQNYGQSDVILVGLAVYGIFGLLSDAVLRYIERRSLSWRKTLAG
jgi:sulfonate transport system permease protein